jgi:hypothetical protein
MVNILKKYGVLQCKIAIWILRRIPGCVMLDEVNANSIINDFSEKSMDKIYIHQYDTHKILFIILQIAGFIAVGIKTLVMLLLLLRYTDTIFESIFSFLSSTINENDEQVGIFIRIGVGLLFAIFILLFITLIEGVAIAAHEWMHCLGHGFNSYISYDGVTSIHAFKLSWDTKLISLLSIIMPFVLFSLLAFIVYLFSGHVLFSMFILFMGIAHSSKDIGGFFVRLLYIPRGTFTFGPYYKKQR